MVHGVEINDPHYAVAVVRDQAVSVGPPLLGETPVPHVAYFNSRKVMRPIAQRLAIPTQLADCPPARSSR